MKWQTDPCALTHIQPWLQRGYGWILHLYPQAYRNTFANEMHAVFAEALAVAVRKGWYATAVLCWRELRDCPRLNALNNLTVGEALYFTGHLRGLSRRDAQQERDALLDEWQIGNLRDKYSSRLSGGQRRLLRLVVAIAGRLPVLILDEPTNDLDPQRRRMVWENLRQLNQREGTTIIFITHDAIEAEKIIERVGIMRAGELAAVGRPSALKQQVAQQLRMELLFRPDLPPTLPAYLAHNELQPGRWLTWLDRNEVGAVLDGLNLGQLDDFRLTSATLEDLYVHYTNQPSTPPTQ